MRQMAIRLYGEDGPEPVGSKASDRESDCDGDPDDSEADDEDDHLFAANPDAPVAPAARASQQTVRLTIADRVEKE